MTQIMQKKKSVTSVVSADCMATQPARWSTDDADYAEEKSVTSVISADCMAHLPARWSTDDADYAEEKIWVLLRLVGELSQFD